MKRLVHEKTRAIEMRKKGMSYRDILKEVHVAKSSLSLWLKDLPLTRREKQSLKKRRDSNISRGRIRAGAQNRKNRLLREHEYYEEAKIEFAKVMHEPFFHIGISLYWAEGAKRNNQFFFMNSDHDMIETMILWLETYCNYSRLQLRYRLFIHKPYAHEHIEQFWMKTLRVTDAQFTKTIHKPTNLGVKKRPNYKGCLRIEVPKSNKLLCKMKFWQSMQVEYCMKQ